jgi:hypothetical protein
MFRKHEVGPVRPWEQVAPGGGIRDVAKHDQGIASQSPDSRTFEGCCNEPLLDFRFRCAEEPIERYPCIAGSEVEFLRCGWTMVVWADLLALITSVQPTANEWANPVGNRTSTFDGGPRDALASVELPITGKGLGWA